MIRRAIHSDLPVILRKLDKLRLASAFGRFPVEWERVELMVEASIAAGSLFVHDESGKIKGFIIAATRPLWWNQNVKIGTDVFFAFSSTAGGVALLSRAIEWCMREGCDILQFGISSSSRLADVAPMYLSAGLRQDGSTFVMNREEYAVCQAS